MSAQSKPDKLPYLDPSERGIFDRIIAACVTHRARRKILNKAERNERDEMIAVNLANIRRREDEEARLELERHFKARYGGLTNVTPIGRPIMTIQPEPPATLRLKPEPDRRPDPDDAQTPDDL